MDNEVKGEGNSLNYTFRMHDPRVGRFFAPDPLEKNYPFYSPYQFSGNRVIDMVELEGLETGNGATDYLYWAIWGYFNKLGNITKDGVKNMVEGGTKSNSYINENPVYSQQDKDNLHTLQKVAGASQVISAAIDPAVQLMNGISPVDDVLTLTTGQIHDVAEVRRATTLEKVFAGAEVISFAFDVSVLTKPTQKIVAESTEEVLEETSKEIVQQSIKGNKNANDAIGNFAIYEVFVDGADGTETILKVGKADADDIMKELNRIRRAHTSARLAEKEGYKGAKFRIIENLGETTTKAAKDVEAARVRKLRSEGNELPLNRERGKAYQPKE